MVRLKNRMACSKNRTRYEIFLLTRVWLFTKIETDDLACDDAMLKPTYYEKFCFVFEHLATTTYTCTRVSRGLYRGSSL